MSSFLYPSLLHQFAVLLTDFRVDMVLLFVVFNIRNLLQGFGQQ